MNWLYKISDARDYLSFLNVLPQISDWVMQQSNPQIYINKLHQNPQLSINQLQEIPTKQKPEFTPVQLAIINEYEEPTKTWIAVQIRKLNKMKYFYPEGSIQLRPNIVGQVNNFVNMLNNILDWVEDTNAQLSSYDFFSAKQESDKWHEEAANLGKDLTYDPVNPHLIVFSYNNPDFPSQWHGWTIQKVMSENDLKVEGFKCNHCVGKSEYSRAVNDGAIEIYSLRDQNNNPHVTIEIQDNAIQQVQGYGNSEPKQVYKQMIYKWLSLSDHIYAEGEQEFDFRYTDNRKIEDELLDALSARNEYGAKIANANWVTAYESVMKEFINESTGYSYCYNFMLKSADIIAEGAVRADLKLLQDEPELQSVFDKQYISQKQTGYIQDYKARWNRKSQISELLKIIDHNSEELYQYVIENMDIHYPEDKDNLAIQEYENQEEEIIKSHRNEYLPYKFDDRLFVKMKELTQNTPLAAIF